MTLTKVSNVNSNYILINLIAGSLKADVLDKYLSLLNWIEQLSVKFNNYNVFILSDSNFSQLRFDIDNSFNNIYFLKDGFDLKNFDGVIIFPKFQSLIIIERKIITALIAQLQPCLSRIKLF